MASSGRSRALIERHHPADQGGLALRQDSAGLGGSRHAEPFGRWPGQSRQRAVERVEAVSAAEHRGLWRTQLPESSLPQQYGSTHRAALPRAARRGLPRQSRASYAPRHDSRPVRNHQNSLLAPQWLEALLPEQLLLVEASWRQYFAFPVATPGPTQPNPLDSPVS